jgi:hypothetical protein
MRQQRNAFQMKEQDKTREELNTLSQARILEWVAIPFSQGSSQPKGSTQVSHIAG